MRVRRAQQPKRYKDSKRYKPFLRVDFTYRCAYCGVTEHRWGSERNFVVEHFRPRSLFPELATHYPNLYYACNRCNDLKGDQWPSEAQWREGVGWVDPCLSDPEVDHLAERPDGTLTPLSLAGHYTIEHLRLNRREYLVVWRRERRRLREDMGLTERLIRRVERRELPGLGAEWREELRALIASHGELCARLAREY